VGTSTTKYECNTVNVQVSSEVLGLSVSAHLGPTWHQKRLWYFLRGLTIIFLCTLLHGTGSRNFIRAVSPCNESLCAESARESHQGCVVVAQCILLLS
jgi:hypothetical protein